MSKKYERRVSELVKDHLHTLIMTRVSDPRLLGVTITDVEVSPDTRIAKVYWSVIGDAEIKTQAQRGLESAAGFLRRQLGATLRTRHTPELFFEFDPSLEYGDHMSRVLDEVKAREASRTPPPPQR